MKGTLQFFIITERKPGVMTSRRAVKEGTQGNFFLRPSAFLPYMHSLHSFLSFVESTIFSFRTSLRCCSLASQVLAGAQFTAVLAPPRDLVLLFFFFYVSENTRRTLTSVCLNLGIFPSQFLAMGLSHGCGFSCAASDEKN